MSNEWKQPMRLEILGAAQKGNLSSPVCLNKPNFLFHIWSIVAEVCF